MELKQIATILNNTLVPNALGGESTTIIAEDLSNIVDFGKEINADGISADTFKDYTRGFVPEVVKTWFDTRKYKMVDIPIFKDYADYCGLLQKIRPSGELDAVDSPIFGLQDNVEYKQDTYHAPNFDNRIFDKDTIYQLEYSIPLTMWRSAFTVEGMQTLVSFIITSVENEQEMKMESLVHSVLVGAILKASGKRVKLLTLYNELNTTQITAHEALTNMSFLRWAYEIISNVRYAMAGKSNKYNDGTITTFTPARDNHLTMLSVFANAVRFNMLADTYHRDDVDLNDYSIIPYWQYSGSSLVPSLETIGNVIGKLDGEEVNTEVDNVVAVAYDDSAIGVTSKPDTIDTHYNAKGRFTNYFHNFIAKYFVDYRANIVVFTLE